MSKTSRRARLTASITAWAAALAIFILRWTCRVRLHGDPRPRLRSQGRSYVYAVMHAHQVAAIIDGEPGTGAMVSQSLDGQIIVPALKIRGIVPVRGSGGRGQRRGRGGLVALEALIQHVKSGHPAYLAVDGPRGPRGSVQRGIANLAGRTDSAIICLVPIPSRRWILSKAWDRLQIPKPFSCIDAYFAEPIFVSPEESDEQLRRRVESTLHALEQRHDPQEAAFLHTSPSAVATDRAVTAAGSKAA